MTSYIKKLPAIFQTVTEKKFFDATVDQVFSKKDSDLLYGYIGQRIPGQYNPVNDFYLPEPSKDRTWWQLEATAFSRNADSTKSNIFFYDDLLNRINYYGGNTLNQDRLFESEYYSWAPPIDFDMFINYQNYYWVEAGLVTIQITGVMYSDIVGQSSYTTPSTATPANLTLTTGMNIFLSSDPAWQQPLTVENIGGCAVTPMVNNIPTGGIRLIPQFPDYTAGTILEYLPWDGTIQLTSGRTISNPNWDTSTWDVQPQPGNGDYITIERGSIDGNAWSRTNKWFHINAINATVQATGTPFPLSATRALRPIIQFSADLVLFDSGTNFKSDITFGFRDNAAGNPLILVSVDGLMRDTAETILGVPLVDGETVIFMNDIATNHSIYKINIDQITSVVTFSVISTVVNEDIVFAVDNAAYDGVQRGQTWYLKSGVWTRAAYDKVANNQPPMFQLYDHNSVPLNDINVYPNSTFAGSKIFSYKINVTPGATIDTVLRVPLVYTSLGQASDIVFQNNLITDRYVYSTLKLPINGYYYYKTATTPVVYNNWNLYSPGTCTSTDTVALSKQRVIDKFVVGYGTQYQFKLSVEPYGYPMTPDVIVNVNGIEVSSAANQTNGYTFVTINNQLYIDLQTYLTALLSTTQAQPPVVEIATYTHGLLDPSSPGYSEIPQQLNANPTQQEITEISASNLIQQFSSIIENQSGFVGSAFGGNNNYRDSFKNRSVGSFILQNVAPMLKSMLISSDSDLDLIAGIRFSQDEYTKFKNKYLSIALQLINQEFSPVQYHNNTVIISAWVEAILKTVNISKEFSNAFAYSYMIANGTPYASETHIVPAVGPVTLSNYLDLVDPQNALYIYDTSGNERLLLIGVDYEISSVNLSIEVTFSAALVGQTMFFALYKNPLPAYIPSTPTKVGAYSVHIPRIEWDTSYTIPTWVIIGHDGSKSITYGDYDANTEVFTDYRDALLLELEKRIYNLLQYRFRNQYYLPLRLEDVKSGYFRQSRYSREEYLRITESYLNKWSAKNKANYRINDWVTSSANPLLNPNDIWKLYNYTTAVDDSGTHLGLHGNWKGIFQFYYDTIFPNTRPWEMLGFTSMPSWWISQYGANWSSTNIALWGDLESGIIRQGPCAIFDPITLQPQPQEMWARPGMILNNLVPVDSSGNIRSVPNIFGVAIASPYAPFDGFDNEWKYGDGAPVEQAWMSTSGYAFSVQEFLYLMRPGPFGELMFDPIGTEISAGMITDPVTLPNVELPVMSTTNWQYVQNDTFTNADTFFAWMRPKNADQIVHAEIVDGVVQIRYGYQRWISDRILFLGKDIATVFGQKVRTLNVNLANKLAGFTNKDTTSTYIESVSTSASTTSLLVPTNNFDVILHKGQPIKTYSYSGVVVRILDNGLFIVYGYDLLNSEFTVLDRSNAQTIDITIGGTPAEFKTYTIGETYYPGDIVRYNGVYYLSIGTIVASKFDISNWQKLRALPTVGGVSVSYMPLSKTTYTKVPYGTVLNSVQEVFDLLIGYGAWLETQGWQFTDVNSDTNQISDWLYVAKQFLFWLNTNWAADASIQLSPSANSATLIVERGYPDDVEKISNGVYSILDKYGVAIPTNSTTTDRDGLSITVAPSDLSVGGIFFLQVNASETEHILIFDNITSFSDVIYDPLLRARQQRLRFNGFRSNNWYGKQEAAGYLIIDNQMVPNFDTIVDSMKYYYDPDITIDNPSLEALGRHLIGYESKSYLDNLQVSNDVQYLFYQGAIRQKGTVQSFDKLFRSTKVQSNETIEVYEEWALKLGKFGNTIEQVSTEFILIPEQNTGEVIVARLNFIPSPIGFVKEINILNAEKTYTNVPNVIISAPDADPMLLTEPLRQARAYVILDAAGVISRVDITDPGYGYLTAPTVTINSGTESYALDKLYAVWQGEITRDTAKDNIIEIDIDNSKVWTVRPPDPTYSLEFPSTSLTEYATPNAGYVHFNDVTWTSFDTTQTYAEWGTVLLNPKENNTVWVAKNFIEDWNVYKMVNVTQPSSATDQWKIVEEASGNLLLLTTYTVESTLSVIPQNDAYVTAKLVNGYISSIEVTLGGSGYATVPAVSFIGGGGTGATATAVLTNGSVTSITINNGGIGYATIPAVTIAAPVSGITALAAAEILASVGIDTISQVGGFFSAAPAVTILGSSTAADIATATATIHTSGILIGQINSIIMSDAGAGYTTIPSVIIGDADPIISASLTPVVNAAGNIVSVTIVDGGSGYTTGATIIATRASLVSGTDAVMHISSVDSTGKITAVDVDIQGTGYEPLVGEVIVPQLSTTPGDQTDFGNTICLQVVATNGTVSPSTNYVVGFADNGLYTDPTSLVVYNSYSLLDLIGTPITATDISVYADITDLLLFKAMRFQETPAIIPSYVLSGDKVWIDFVETNWNVSIYTPTATSVFTQFRVQEKLINTSLFESAQVYQTETQTELVMLPVYDPFKNILPALAKQNITYMVLNDPARYNVSGNTTLYSQNITFGEAQVGKLWWDLSTIRYAYYEQPIALDGSELPTDNLVYRRDRWGQLFPGSLVNIYEWTKSDVPPAEYTGTGTPRSTTNYVQLTTSNTFTNISQTSYYFWVLNPIDKPNIENRTMAALDVSRLLSSPKGQGFAFFAPIQQTSSNNAYMFYNVQEILAYKGNNIQIQYRLAQRDDQKHTQWKFFREGDTGSLVTDQFWNKLVDSLCAYTVELPNTEKWPNSIIVADKLPWDVYGWDISPYDDAIDTTHIVYSEILPVPDPSLGEAEKYGIDYRPRQGMFVDLYAARKIFVQAGNKLLKYIPIRDNNVSWNNESDTDAYQGIYWDYTNWYEVGYEDITPTIVFSTLALAQSALNLGQLPDSAIVEVIDGTTDGRFVLYEVVQLNKTVTTQSFKKVGIESSAIKLLDTIYTVKNVYSLSTEIRHLMNALRTEVFINKYIVDQNSLYFAMLNYVYSEQKNPDWTFKTSYIYIKENNIPLTQSALYIPDQINNIISYIVDSKPYHTQIRDYTSTYLTSDVAVGTATDSMQSKTILTFGPTTSKNYVPEQNYLTAIVGWDLNQGQYIEPWDTINWDVPVDLNNNLETIDYILNQYVSYNPVLPNYNPGAGVWPDLLPIELTFYDTSKKGLSELFPYTFSLTTLDGPQSFITPENVVYVKVGNTTLIYGKDYFVGYNDANNTYTVYFFNDPSAEIATAYVLFDGGQLMNVQFNTYRNELALGYGIDNFVVNTDTKLLVNNNNGVYTAFSDMWDMYDPVINDVILVHSGPPQGWDSGGVTMWDQGTTEYAVELDYIVSFKESFNTNFGASFYRNSRVNECLLAVELVAPAQNVINTIYVYVDPVIHANSAFVLPKPTANYTPAIWINGERIEYMDLNISETILDTWELKSIRRGTQGTMPDKHVVLSKIFVERFNKFNTIANVNVWNAGTLINPAVSTTSSNIVSVPLGGLWYAQTPEAIFLKNGQGSAINP